MSDLNASPLFQRAAIIGIGLIGSSIACALRAQKLAKCIVCADVSLDHVQQALELEIVDEASTDCASMVRGADLVVLCVPVGSMGMVASLIAPHLAEGCLVTDVGSVKQSVWRDVAPCLPPTVSFIPAHPIAGTAESGPGAGFAELFQDRWCLLTPPDDVNKPALAKLAAMWSGFGSKVEVMSIEQHDRTLATISHLPQLVAYNVVMTAGDIEDENDEQVIKYAAGGFRDVTRIAASDPVMWRDIFLNNRDAVLPIIKQFAANFAFLERAVEGKDSVALEDFFARARAIKRSSTTN